MSNASIEIDLHQLLSTFLKSNKSSIVLNVTTAKTLRHVLNCCPKIIDNLNTHIVNIISDDVIDSKDLPQFILMFNEIINANIKDLKKIKVTKSDLVSLIESIMLILLETDVIKTGEKKEEFKALLNLSVQILDSSINLSETVTCNWKCF
jgi:hypothetical protein